MTRIHRKERGIVGTPKAYRKNRELWEGQGNIGEKWNFVKYKRSREC